MGFGFGRQGRWLRCGCGHSFYIAPAMDSKECIQCGTIHWRDGMPDAITEDEIDHFAELLHHDHILAEDF